MASDRIVLYGSLMQGLGAIEEIALGRHLVFERPAAIPGELFDLGAYPGLRHGPGRVVGELYTIHDPGVLHELDVFEGVLPGRPAQSLYLREKIRLIDPPEAEVWVYLYNRSPAREQRIRGGDWRIHLAQRGHR